MQTPIDSLLESFPGGAAIIGPDARVVQVNSYLAEKIGPCVGRTCYKVLAGIESVCPFCAFEELVTGSAGQEMEGIQIRQNDRCSVRVSSVKEKQSRFIFETVSNLSEQESPEGLDVPECSNKLANLLLISRILLGKTPFEEKITDVVRQISLSMDDPTDSRVWVEIDDVVYGKPPEELQGKQFQYEIIAKNESRGFLYVDRGVKEMPADEEDYLEEVAQLIGSKLEMSDLKNRLRQSEQQYKAQADALGQEMERSTTALAEQSSYLEAILRYSDDMIITTDLDSRIVVFNPGAERMLGYKAEEVRDTEVGDLWVDAAERKKIMDEVNASGGIRNYETRLRTKNGETIEISLTLSLLRNQQGKILGTVGVSKDISREKAIMRELEQVNQNFREAIHFLNHETKNSLIVIGGFVKRLLDKETDPGKKEHLQIIYHHSQFLEAMSRDFLFMAEIEHGEFTVRKQLIQNFYDEVIRPAITGLRERYPDSFESYDTSMGGVGAIRLQGDPSLLEIVYRNLFGNALKYSNPGGKLAYGFVDQGDSFLFNVWNTGPGVEPHLVERIFDKFYRVRDDSTRGKRGTGLGLYNVRKIIEAHGGRIWCESKPGEWINFLFVLPKE